MAEEEADGRMGGWAEGEDEGGDQRGKRGWRMRNNAGGRRDREEDGEYGMVGRRKYED